MSKNVTNLIYTKIFINIIKLNQQNAYQKYSQEHLYVLQNLQLR